MVADRTAGNSRSIGHKMLCLSEPNFSIVPVYAKAELFFFFFVDDFLPRIFLSFGNFLPGIFCLSGIFCRESFYQECRSSLSWCRCLSCFLGHRGWSGSVEYACTNELIRSRFYTWSLQLVCLSKYVSKCGSETAALCLLGDNITVFFFRRLGLSDTEEVKYKKHASIELNLV